MSLRRRRGTHPSGFPRAHGDPSGGVVYPAIATPSSPPDSPHDGFTCINIDELCDVLPMNDDMLVFGFLIFPVGKNQIVYLQIFVLHMDQCLGN
jgi:hypothetical protein